MKRMKKGFCLNIGFVKWMWHIPVVLGIAMGSVPGIPDSGRAETSRVLVEDFTQSNSDGFPVGWEAQRSLETAKKTYQIHQEGDSVFLRAQDASQRIFIRYAWDPRKKPVVTWRWRAKVIPEGAEFVAAVFVSLDTDLMVIPVATKYLWSPSKKKGTITEGGLFGAAEVVIRSGKEPVGEWVQEQVNAYEDFLKIHRHEPAPEAWGISLLGGPGVEVDFGSITIQEAK